MADRQPALRLAEPPPPRSPPKDVWEQLREATQKLREAIHQYDPPPVLRVIDDKDVSSRPASLASTPELHLGAAWQEDDCEAARDESSRLTNPINRKENQ